MANSIERMTHSDKIYEYFLRWIMCMLRTTEILGIPLASLYINKIKRSAPVTKAAVTELSNKIIEAMKEEIEEIDWMDTATKNAAFDKVHSTIALVGYSEALLDVQQIDRNYEELKVDSVNFMSNMVQGLMISREAELRKLKFSPKRNSWSSDIALLKPNAYYNFEGNRIVIPIAILAPYLFVANAPKCINYGAIGSIIGHELTHGFDYKGRNYGHNGNIRPWWSEKSADLYFRRSKESLFEHVFKFIFNSLKICDLEVLTCIVFECNKDSIVI